MAEGDLDDPTDYGTTVRNNLMKRPGYAPYCGNDLCMSRAPFDGDQFKCRCGWRSSYPSDFIDGYKARWHKEPTP